MRAAVIDLQTNIVLIFIVADANIDPYPAGSILVNLSDDSLVSHDWIYNPIDQSFINPNPAVNEGNQ